MVVVEEEEEDRGAHPLPLLLAHTRMTTIIGRARAGARAALDGLLF